MKLELSNKKVTLERFSMISKFIGVQIPESFYKLLKENDGAYPSLDKFNYFDIFWREVIETSAGAFLCINPDEYGDLLFRYQNPPEFFPKDIIAFADVGNGDFICFDYREGKDNPNPPIVYWNHEADIGQDVSFVAKDFEAFIGMLKSDDEL